MSFKQHQIFRREITPWYDSDPACVFLVVLAAGCLVFAGIGIKVTLTSPEFGSYVWFPCLLAFLCLVVIIKVVTRMIARNKNDSEF
ncbi:MAG: hypothetical protein R6V54_03920 [Desulfobacteraceae bacterium]